mgnify:CR=1 FL=1
MFNFRYLSHIFLFCLIFSACALSNGPQNISSSDQEATGYPLNPIPVGAQEELNWMPSNGWDIFSPTSSERLEMEKDPEAYRAVKNRSLSVWSEKNVSVDTMSLFLSKCLTQDKCRANDREHEYLAGELTSERPYESGRLQATFQAVKGSGVVTSMFVYRKSEGEVLNEIDIEVLGKDPTEVHLTYWVDGKSYGKVLGGDILGSNFDAASQAHHYAFEWDYQRIAWYIDNKCVYYVEKNNTDPFISHPMYIILNLWISNSGETWAGDVNNDTLFPTDDTTYTVNYKDLKFYPVVAPASNEFNR